MESIGNPVSMTRTKWPGIRFALFEESTGCFQLAEQHAFREDLAHWLGSEPELSSNNWVNLIYSGLSTTLKSLRGIWQRQPWRARAVRFWELVRLVGGRGCKAVHRLRSIQLLSFGAKLRLSG